MCVWSVEQESGKVVVVKVIAGAAAGREMSFIQLHSFYTVFITQLRHRLHDWSHRSSTFLCMHTLLVPILPAVYYYIILESYVPSLILYGQVHRHSKSYASDKQMLSLYVCMWLESNYIQLFFSHLLYETKSFLFRFHKKRALLTFSLKKTALY